MSFDLESGQIRDGPRQYLMMRADVLMAAFDGLPPAARDAALDSLGRAVCELGGGSARAYLAEVGPPAFLDAMVEGAAALGWGRWRFEQHEDELRLQVEASPFATATRARQGTACHAITGMLTAVAAALWSGPAQAEEIACACGGGTVDPVCRFVAARSRLPPSGSQNGKGAVDRA